MSIHNKFNCTSLQTMSKMYEHLWPYAWLNNKCFPGTSNASKVIFV